MVRTEPITVRASGLQFTALQAGADNRDTVLCLHGFPDGPTTFRKQFETLVAAGYRVIAPTMRGYEPSSQPADRDFSLTTLADDVAGMLDDLGLGQVHLVGHDWGAAVAYVTAARHGDRLLTATAMAVPPLARIPEAVRRVPRQLQRSWYMTFFQLPGLSDRALAADDWRLVRRLRRSWSPGHTMSPADWDELRALFDQPGVRQSMLAYYRQNATPTILAGLRSTPAMELAQSAVPMLIIHGRDDGCMDRRMFDHTIRSEDHPHGLRRLEVPAAGHFVHQEQPDQVNAALLDHFTV